MKAALIGCGGMGSGHARSAPEHGVEVVAFCDVIEAAAERARAEFGGRYATTDAGRIMRDDSIDLVIIATHHDAHHPLAMAGARAGKHLLVEKPLCQTREQAIEVAEAVGKAGVKLIVNCKFRIAPTVQKAKELIPHPRLSHGQLATANYAHKPPGAGGSTWIWDKDDGGGLLVSTAVHSVDLLAYLMDSAADRVYAEGRLFDPKNKGTAGYPDGLVGTILWRNGGLSTVISTDQGISPNPWVSKWFHEMWDGERSAVFTAHIGRVDFLEGARSATSRRRSSPQRSDERLPCCAICWRPSARTGRRCATRTMACRPWRSATPLTRPPAPAAPRPCRASGWPLAR